MAPAHKTFTALLCPSSQVFLLLIVSVIFFQILHFAISSFPLLNFKPYRARRQHGFYSIAWRQKRKRSSETKFSVSGDLLSQQQPCSFPPSGGGRLGWGWLRGLRRNQIRAAHRATLSPTLSRQTGEGAGCTSWHRFLSTRQFQPTSCRISNLVPSPVWRGKVRMGVASLLGEKSNWYSP